MTQTQAYDDSALSELKQWGGASNEMSAFESVMWRAEVDPRLRSTTTSVLFLDRVPEWERLQAGHRWVVQAVPRFRQRVMVPALGVGNPAWVEDENFQLDYHLRRVSLPAPGSERQLFDLAANLAMTPFDKSRSPWEATLVEGLEGGRAAYILKLHHATSDGLGIIQLLSRVLRKSPEQLERPRLRADSSRRRGPQTPTGLTTKRLRDGLLALPSETAGRLSGIAQALRDWSRDPEALSKGRDYLRSAQRVLAVKPVKGSGLFRNRSLSWRFDAVEIPLADLKAAAKAADATLNDAFLSGLIGGFRRYHEEMGVEVRPMPIGFPISIRTKNDAMGGNKFAGSQYAAPVAEKDPVARVRHIQEFVRKTRAEPAMDILVRAMPLVTRLPMSAIVSMTSNFTSAQDAQISNVPGIAHPVYMSGAQITHFWPYAPVPGCGMMITMMSHNGRCCIGINSDRAAVTEPDLLVQCLREGLEEMLAVGRK